MVKTICHTTRSMDDIHKIEEDHTNEANRIVTLSYSVGDVTEIHIPSTYSVTAALNYCKNKILKPYLRLLNIVGLRPFTFGATDNSCLDFFSYLYSLQVIIFMIIGYILQYMACFRRDRGFGCKSMHTTNMSMRDDLITYEEICHSSLLFTYILPNALHLLGYLLGILSFRSSDDDQLPSLMERVFLSVSTLSDGFMSQKKLVRILWSFVSISTVWMILSFVSMNFMMAEGSIDFKWMEDRPSNLLILMKILLLVCTLWQDIIQATLISNYCLQTQLLTTYLQFLRAKLLQYPIQPIEWMKDIEEFKKLLKFLNEHLAPAVCVFTTINISCALSGLLWLLNYDRIDVETVPIIGISILNILLWFLIAVAPFIQAAKLTSACTALKTVGHEVRVRPFVHQTTPANKLDCLLLYSCSLEMNAKLFGMPINARWLSLLFTVSCVIMLTLGQLHYFNVRL